jgi:hypothetical protein
VSNRCAFLFNTSGQYLIQVIANNPTFDGCSGEQDLSFILTVIYEVSKPFDLSVKESSNTILDESVINLGSFNSINTDVPSQNNLSTSKYI